MPDADLVPDVYADQFVVTAAVWGVNLSFLRNPPHPAPGQAPQPHPQAIVRMSLEHAKIMTMLLRQQLLKYERDNGTEILIPQTVYAALGVSREDWG